MVTGETLVIAGNTLVYSTQRPEVFTKVLGGSDQFSRQVSVTAEFKEVTQSELDSLGVQWPTSTALTLSGLSIGPVSAGPALRVADLTAVAAAMETNKVGTYQQSVFTLDKKGLASCYDTARGIGVQGSNADIGRKAKGISIWWAVVGCFLAAGACYFIPMMLGKGAQHYLTKDVKTPEALANSAAQPKTDKPAVQGMFQPQSGPQANTLVMQPGAVTSVAVTGFVLTSTGKVQALLTDGSVMVNSSNVQAVDPAGAVILADGSRLVLKPAQQQQSQDRSGPFVTK